MRHRTRHPTPGRFTPPHQHAARRLTANDARSLGLKLRGCRGPLLPVANGVGRTSKRRAVLLQGGHAPEFRALHYSKVIRVNDRPPEVITRPTPMATGLQGPKGWPTRFPPLGHPNTSTAATDAHSGQRPPRRPCEPFQCPRGDALQVKTLSLGGSGGIFVLTMVLRDAPTTTPVEILLAHETLAPYKDTRYTSSVAQSSLIGCGSSASG